MKFIGIIPARYASTRFPGKPLADIDGIPMVVRVVRQALKALPRVIVATDDERILHAVTEAGHEAVMTSTAHRSGTDRCYEALVKSGSDADVVINIQGDEPFVTPDQIRSLMGCFDDADVDIATLARRFPADGSYAALADPNTPKVVISEASTALYFSRSVIPYLRGRDKEEWPAAHQYLTHVGMYAYRTDALARIVTMPQSPLELTESLEQLRWLQGGMTIAVGMTDDETVGIDTPDDLRRAVEFLRQRGGAI